MKAFFIYAVRPASGRYSVQIPFLPDAPVLGISSNETPVFPFRTKIIWRLGVSQQLHLAYATVHRSLSYE